MIDGLPLILLEKGKWHTDILRQARIDQTDVMAVARTKEMRTLDEIKYAVLERNGAISVIPKGGGS